jgi:RNA polymerase sigma-70 factor (ECF subfamily)
LLRDLTHALRRFVCAALARTSVGGSEAEDVVQEILLAVHLKRHTWRTDEPLRPWLYAIARHKVIDHLRRNGRRITLNIDDFADVLPGEEKQDGLSGDQIERAVTSLSSREGQVVRGCTFEGRSLQEVAAHLGIAEGAVRVALHRGLANLARRFGKE